MPTVRVVTARALRAVPSVPYAASEHADGTLPNFSRKCVVQRTVRLAYSKVIYSLNPVTSKYNH
jgi:hypothetical protein